MPPCRLWDGLSGAEEPAAPTLIKAIVACRKMFEDFVCARSSFEFAFPLEQVMSRSIATPLV